MRRFDKESLNEALNDFQRHLRSIGIKEKPREQRMRGAREFARFLVGRPHQYREVTKGRPL